MYINEAEYGKITDRPYTEATGARIQMASMLLDSRIGNHPILTTGYKLNVSTLPVVQKNAVQTWVACMVAFLTDNNDTAPSGASVTLGKFSVVENQQSKNLLPEELGFADSILVSSGVIKRGVVVI